jgi:hypothetical protein
MPRAATQAVSFRFDAANHDYINVATGETFPHITGMLADTGWIDDTWYTEESSDRGVAVHRLTADYDLKALDVASCTSRFRGYLLAHVKAVSIMQPTMLAVEEPLVHPHFGFGGRPDRDALVRRLRATWEVKSGQPDRAHGIQTALQAILIAIEAKLRPEAIGRFCCYVKDKGRFKLEEHTSKRDFDEARRVIRQCTGVR